MGRIKLREPRDIDPALVEIGDEISVHHKAKNGVSMSLRGIVAARNDHGKTRTYVTSENGTLFSVNTTQRHGLTITLHSRSEMPGQSLFEIDEIRERLAG